MAGEFDHYERELRQLFHPRPVPLPVKDAVARAQYMLSKLSITQMSMQTLCVLACVFDEEARATLPIAGAARAAITPSQDDHLDEEDEETPSPFLASVTELVETASSSEAADDDPVGGDPELSDERPVNAGEGAQVVTFHNGLGRAAMYVKDAPHGKLVVKLVSDPDREIIVPKSKVKWVV